MLRPIILMQNGSDIVIQNGGELKLLKYLDGHSTTNLILNNSNDW